MNKLEEKNSIDIRKKQIKKIEYHLKNYNNYMAAIRNLKKQLEYQESREKLSINDSSTRTSVIVSLKSKLSQNQIIIESIDIAISELNEIEKQLVTYRYFKNWTIKKTAMQIGYSDKSLFVIRNQLMDKLIISLSSILHL